MEFKLAVRQRKNNRLLAMIYSPKQLGLRNFPPMYADAILTADPGATAVLATEDREGVRRLHRFFVCPGVSRHAVEYCRCFLTMDGAFTKEIFRPHCLYGSVC